MKSRLALAAIALLATASTASAQDDWLEKAFKNSPSKNHQYRGSYDPFQGNGIQAASTVLGLIGGCAGGGIGCAITIGQTVLGLMDQSQQQPQRPQYIVRNVGVSKKEIAALVRREIDGMVERGELMRRIKVTPLPAPEPPKATSQSEERVLPSLFTPEVHVGSIQLASIDYTYTAPATGRLAALSRSVRRLATLPDEPQIHAHTGHVNRIVLAMN